MVLLVGYSVAGVRIVVVVRSGRMLVVWVTACCCRLAPRRWEAVRLSRSAKESSRIVILWIF